MGEGPVPDEIIVQPGPLFTSREKRHIPNGHAQSLLNCDTSRGVFELDDRYRQFQGAPAGGNARGLGYANFGNLNEIQTITITGGPTGGDFTLTFSGQTTAPIVWNATIAQVLSALEALSNIDPGDVLVYGGQLPSGSISVEFINRYGGTDIAALSANSAGLTGPGGPYTVVITETRKGGSYEEYVAIQNNAPYKINASEVSNADGSLTTAWSALTDPGVSGGTWNAWQWGPLQFFAADEDSQVVMYKTVGQNDLRFLRELVGDIPDGSLTTALPPYEKRNWLGTDAFVGSAISSGTVTSGAVANGILSFDGYATSVQSGILLTLDAQFDAAARPNCDDNDYLGYTITCTAPYAMASIDDVRLRDSGGTYRTVPHRVTFNAAGTQALIAIGMHNLTRTQRNALRELRVRIRLNAVSVGLGRFQVAPLTIGGRYLTMQGAFPSTYIPAVPDAADTKYAYRYFRNANTYSDLKYLVANREMVAGEFFGTERLGSHLALSIPSTAASGFVASDTVQVFRLIRRPNGGPGFDWYKIAEYANTGTISHTDVLNAAEVQSTYSIFPDLPEQGTISTGTSRAVTQVTCGCAWKGANVMFKKNGKGYFSTVNKPIVFLWDGIVADFDPEDPGAPVALTIAYDQSSPVIAVVPQEAIYMFTRKEGYAMSGPTPALASFPFLVPGIRGAVGRYAACGIGDGAMFGSDDGLWYVAVPKNYEGEESARTLTKLTENLNATWVTLLGSSASSLCVAHVLDEIWCFCQTRYLHRTREGAWVYGEWANGKSVQSVASDPRRGIALQFTDGTVGIIGDFPTDGGTNALGTNGSVPSWSYTTKRHMEPRHIRAGYCQWTPGSQSDVRLTVNSERATSKAIAFTDAKGVETVQFKRADNPGGDWWEITVSGLAGDIVEAAVIDGAPMDRRRTSRA